MARWRLETAPSFEQEARKLDKSALVRVRRYLTELTDLDDPRVRGRALVAGPGNTPPTDGSRVYLNVGEDIIAALAKVEAGGGKVVVPKTEIGNDFGFFAMWEDTEGNLLGFHSMV